MFGERNFHPPASANTIPRLIDRNGHSFSLKLTGADADS
jgi:hypothetical protein